MYEEKHQYHFFDYTKKSESKPNSLKLFNSKAAIRPNENKNTLWLFDVNLLLLN